jgi:hypothetical protein
MTAITHRDRLVADACRESRTREERSQIIATYRAEVCAADSSLLDKTMQENEELRAELADKRVTINVNALAAAIDRHIANDKGDDAGMMLRAVRHALDLGVVHSRAVANHQSCDELANLERKLADTLTALVAKDARIAELEAQLVTKSAARPITDEDMKAVAGHIRRHGNPYITDRGVRAALESAFADGVPEHAGERLAYELATDNRNARIRELEADRTVVSTGRDLALARIAELEAAQREAIDALGLREGHDQSPDSWILVEGCKGIAMALNELRTRIAELEESPEDAQSRVHTDSFDGENEIQRWRSRAKTAERQLAAEGVPTREAFAALTASLKTHQQLLTAANADLAAMTDRYHESSIGETKLQDRIDAMGREIATGKREVFGTFFADDCWWRKRIADLELNSEHTAAAYLRQLARADLAEARIAHLEAQLAQRPAAAPVTEPLSERERRALKNIFDNASDDDRTSEDDYDIGVGAVWTRFPVPAPATPHETVDDVLAEMRGTLMNNHTDNELRTQWAKRIEAARRAEGGGRG